MCLVLKTVIVTDSKQVKEKFYLPKLKEHLVNKGRTFSHYQ
jgi:hypothetical protein